MLRGLARGRRQFRHTRAGVTMWIETRVAAPPFARIDAAAACQLRCPLCPVTQSDGGGVVGAGFLKAADFSRFLRANPGVTRVELANSGEAVLNRELPEILRIAHEAGVVTEINQGVNLNHASPAVIEALVRYQVARVRVAVDGVTEATYQAYRIGGRLRSVLKNVEAINEAKRRWRSSLPHLVLQFVVFGHNEHELPHARVLARMLGMELQFRLNWSAGSYPVANHEQVRRSAGFADREEFLSQRGRHYCGSQCLDLWLGPQINWDGKLLGCSRNRWQAYADDVFGSDLGEALNGERLRYARAMVSGQAPAREDVPCVRCGVYRAMSETGNWVTARDILEGGIPDHQTAPP